MRKLLLLLALSVIASAAGPDDAYVRVSPRDHRYLELTDGSPYIPIGLNMIAPGNTRDGEDAALRGFEEWISSLAANGGNYIRVWLSSPFWDVEHEKSGVYDAEKAKRIDRMLDLCRKYHVRVKLTMEHFRSIGGGRQAWADKPLHNVTNGGPAQSMADFFDGEASRTQFKRKIAWYRDRYGDQPIVYGWELWNEVNAVTGKGDILAWSQLMLGALHQAFPKNMAMQSMGSFDDARWRELFYRQNSTMPGNDIAQVHRYLDLGARLDICHGPVDLLAADAVREIAGYNPGRPIVLAESGAVEPSHSGPFKLYSKDKDGILLHDILFAPFFAGAAGVGQIWHWDAYVAPNNLWWQFGRFAQVVKGLDPPAENFEPAMAEHDRLRVYLLKGKRTVLAWCRDKQNTWETELRDGQKPEVLKGIAVNLGISKARSVKIYDPWTNRWTNGKIKNGKVALPQFSRSIVIRAEV
ncbi:MAG: cellulase family glycosylhydrolase [Acidobacteriia bacterium]|nr:cellulase family glycosylhydrolase [Terriglobia bacterium]